MGFDEAGQGDEGDSYTPPAAAAVPTTSTTPPASAVAPKTTQPVPADQGPLKMTPVHPQNNMDNQFMERVNNQWASRASAKALVNAAHQLGLADSTDDPDGSFRVWSGGGERQKKYSRKAFEKLVKDMANDKQVSVSGAE